jgi:hypothetical protein
MRRTARSRDSGSSGTRSKTMRAAPAGTPNTARQENALSKKPAMVGPKVSPTPRAVPNRPNTRVRAGPSNVAASSAAPLAAAAAPAAPATARTTSSRTISVASMLTTPVTANTATPNAKTRRRPTRSATEPAASMKLAKVAL